MNVSFPILMYLKKIRCDDDPVTGLIKFYLPRLIFINNLKI